MAPDRRLGLRRATPWGVLDVAGPGPVCGPRPGLEAQQDPVKTCGGA
ncbi:hypothetical protein FHS43_005635 [Streptosporangium becharense]|uniref:Uncharacterized protein n=1 Tax=Streptosporangium becharense TaxID=1816182 RepID=A0A7W9MK16_9ACTN|nr:hypothetical protein [Streptosporangium becharense]MBB2914323.1 hypothetical protein [Streptosporangium becharense]MBB5823645.1 hypothetical protein [Streptosporangium becharense]